MKTFYTLKEYLDDNLKHIAYVSLIISIGVFVICSFQEANRLLGEGLTLLDLKKLTIRDFFFIFQGIALLPFVFLFASGVVFLFKQKRTTLSVIALICSIIITSLAHTFNYPMFKRFNIPYEAKYIDGEGKEHMVEVIKDTFGKRFIMIIKYIDDNTIDFVRISAIEIDPDGNKTIVGLPKTYQ